MTAAFAATFVAGVTSAERMAHQPRDRVVRCRRCTRWTFEVHAVCSACGPETCDVCAPNDSPAVGTPAPGEGGDVAAGSSPRVTAAADPGERGTSAAAEGSPGLPHVDDGVAAAMDFLTSGEELLALAERLHRLHQMRAEQRSTAKRWADVAAAALTLGAALRPAVLPRRIEIDEPDEPTTHDLLPADLGEQFETSTRALTVLAALAEAASAAATRAAEWTGEAIDDFGAGVPAAATCGATTSSFVGIECELDAHTDDQQHRSGPYSWGEPTRG